MKTTSSHNLQVLRLKDYGVLACDTVECLAMRQKPAT